MSFRLRASLPLLSGLALVAACSASSGASSLDDDGGASSSGAGASGPTSVGAGGGLLATSSGAGGSMSDGCSDQAKFVYVLSTDNELYSYRPDQNVFTKIGPLGCNTSMSPNSMAVDRNAVAWVNYVGGDLFGDNQGAIYKVDTTDASCEPTPAATLPSGWFRVGMGFSTNGANTTDETLFVTNISGGSAGLGTIDTTTGALTPVAMFSGAQAGQSAELTGTGDGKLFGFFTSSPVQVVELDKTTAASGTTASLSQVETPLAWAFSFWGGDFYLYTASIGNSRVNRYRPSDGSVDTTYMADAGFTIVGAGVSTCAPLAPPN